MSTKKSASSKTKGSPAKSSASKNGKSSGMRELDTDMVLNDAVVIISLLVAVILLLSNLGMCGPVGVWLKAFQTGLLGVMGYVFPIWLFAAITLIISNGASPRAVVIVISSFMAMLALGGLIHLLAGRSFDEIASLTELYTLGEGGGLLGGLLGGGLATVIGYAGAFLVCGAILIVSLVVVTGRSFVGAVKKGGGEAYAHARTGAMHMHEEHLIKAEERKRRKELAKLANIDLKAQGAASGSDSSIYSDDGMAANSMADDTADDSVAADGYITGHDEDDGSAYDNAYAGYGGQDTGYGDGDGAPYDASYDDKIPESGESDASYSSEDTFGFVGGSGLDARLKALSDDALAQETHSLAAAVSSITMRGNDAFSTPQAMFPGDLTGQLGYESVREYDYTSDDDAYDAADRYDGQEAYDDDFSAYREMLNRRDEEDDSVPFDMYTVLPREGLDDTGVYARADSYTSAASEESSDGYYTGADGYHHETESGSAHTIEGTETESDIYSQSSQGGSVRPQLENEYPSGTYGAEPRDAFGQMPTDNAAKTGTVGVFPSVAAESADIANSKDVSGARSSISGRYVDAGARANSTNTGSTSAATDGGRASAEKDTAPAASLGAGAQPKPQKKPYVLPPTSLLTQGSMTVRSSSDREFGDTARKLQQTLAQFGVKVTVTGVSCGPTVTRYELRPESGVKVAKIVGLTDDIKLALAAADIRVEAPIPGKSAIGIEVPNNDNMTVHLRNLIESEEFRRSKARLLFAVGMDIAGSVVVGDIDKMPHMLIAGATGSGKSVCINTMVLSILYRYAPDEVKLIMVDPKVVELSVYNGIPHLLIPVVTDPKKAAAALNWAVEEMMKRYKMFEHEGVRNISGYNQHIQQLLKDGKRVDESTNLPYEKMPQIVIIIDELADLMMVSKNEVEDAICRIAQLARAAGIHLVIATQRPSVDVITGVIKANIPSRIAFAVSSGVDSRTILDTVGAEKLLGKGDMLYYPQGIPKPVRVQGAFVSDEDIHKVVDFIVQQDLAEYDADTMGKIEARSAAAPDNQQNAKQKEPDERDALFGEAGRYIIGAEKASIGNLQRKFRIGFNRAARIMDQLCECGVVGTEQGTKPREILMTPEEFEDYLQLDADE